MRRGRHAIDRAEPLAELVQDLPVAGSTGTVRGLSDSDRWLFPGRHPVWPRTP